MHVLGLVWLYSRLILCLLVLVSIWVRVHVPAGLLPIKLSACGKTVKNGLKPCDSAPGRPRGSSWLRISLALLIAAIWIYGELHFPGRLAAS